VQAGTPLAYIGEPGEKVEAGAAQIPDEPSAKVQVMPAAEPKAEAGKSPSRISPVVAKIAAEHNVDIAQVPGTGLGGRVTKKDILAFVEQREKGVAPKAELPPWEQPGTGDLFKPTDEVALPMAVPPTAPPAPALPPTVTAPQPMLSGDELMPLTSMRRSIAEHMVRSKHTSPHVTTIFEVDMSRIIAHRQANKAAFERDGARLTFTAYFAMATVAALKAHPLVNSTFTDEGVLVHRQINIGLAVSLGADGLIVPVLRNADQLSLLATARGVNELAERARNKKLSPDDVAGSTVTITNHGTAGSLFATPVINQPNTAILGVGALQKRAIVVTQGNTDMIAIKPMIYIGLTFDHRVLDGASADAFMARLKQVLEIWSA